MNTRDLTVRTGSARGLANLTAACAAFLDDIDAEDGLLSLFVPHATAGLVIVEVGAGEDRGGVAVLAVDWYHVSGFEGASGYLVVFVGLLGGAAGLLIGVLALELRYGLNGEHPRTLDEVGRTFNVTRERIRQIENQSLKKLRALSDSQTLREVA